MPPHGSRPSRSSNLPSNHSPGDAGQNAPLRNQQRTEYSPDIPGHIYTQERVMANRYGPGAGPEGMMETLSDGKSYLEEDFFSQESSSESYQESPSEISQRNFSGCYQECLFGPCQDCLFGSHQEYFFGSHQEQAPQDDTMASRNPVIPSSSAPAGLDQHAGPWSSKNQRGKQDPKSYLQETENLNLDGFQTNETSNSPLSPGSDPLALELGEQEEANQDTHGVSEGDQEHSIQHENMQADGRTGIPAARYTGNPSSPSASITTTKTTTTRTSAASRVYLPMECHHCSESFTGKHQRGNLGRHMRQFHGNSSRNYQCPVCGNQYARGDALRKHQRKRH